MIASKRERDRWKKKYERGDFVKIEKISGVERKAIARGYNSRIMAEKTYNALHDYYEGKPALR